jgi:hypothetical protein
MCCNSSGKQFEKKPADLPSAGFSVYGVVGGVALLVALMSLVPELVPSGLVAAP